MNMLKQHRHGDVREDGKVFWGYLKNRKNPEYWMTQEIFDRNRERSRTRSRQDPPIQNPKPKTLRPKPDIEKLRAQSRESSRKHREKMIALPVPDGIKRSRGDIREDGMRFWCTQRHLHGGQYWITEEKYQRFQAAAYRRSKQKWYGSFKAQRTPEYLERQREAVKRYRARKKTEEEGTEPLAACTDPAA